MSDFCIYCCESNDYCRAHVIPRGLGSFKNQPTVLNRVCGQCDTEIGNYESIMMKIGPPALFRSLLDIRGRSGTIDESTYSRRHHGMNPVEFVVKFPGTEYEVRVAPKRGEYGFRILPQVVIIKPDKSQDQIIVDVEKITVDILDEMIKEKVGKGMFQIWAIADSEEEHKQETIWQLLLESKYHDKIICDERIKPCDAQVEATGTFRVDKRYFQAIAKIAFHYLLINRQDIHGHEDGFRPIKRFIRYGEGNAGDFVSEKEGYLVEDMKHGYRPKYYGNILIGEVKGSEIYVDVQLFVGSHNQPAYSIVRIGENPRKIIVPNEHFGHFYNYYEPAKRDQYDGEMQELFSERNSSIVLPRFR